LQKKVLAPITLVLILFCSSQSTAQQFENGIYFSTQQAFEDGTFPYSIVGGSAPSYVTSTNVNIPFSKIALSNGLTEFHSDFIPVQAGEKLYGEIWAMRQAASSGNPGYFFYGIARYDKDKNPIAGNSALDYFVVSGAMIAQDDNWTKFSGTVDIPLSHTPYSGSDGGAVRYVRAYVIVNYGGGTIPTYWGGMILRRAAPVRDAGIVGFKENVGIGTFSPAKKLDIVTASNVDGVRVIGSSANASLTLVNTASNGQSWELNSTGGTNSNGDGRLTISNSNTVSTTFAPGGNVGIGEWNPGEKLAVKGNIDINSSNFGFTLKTGVYPYKGYWHYSDDGTGYGPSFLHTNTGNSTLTPTMFLQSDGNNATLNVSNAITIGNMTLSALNQYPVMDSRIRISGSPGSHSYFNSGGNVGIGTNAPTQTFEVNGYVKTTSRGLQGYLLGSYGSLSETVSGASTILGNNVIAGAGYHTVKRNANATDPGNFVRLNYYHGITFNTGLTTAFDTEVGDDTNERMRITTEGKVGIGTATPSELLSVNGNIRTKKVIVTQIGWPDYVFKTGYKLPSLGWLENFISKNKHLPGIPSEKEVEVNGVDLGETQALLLKKIEELTLYVIQQNRINEQQQAIIEAQQKELESIKKKLGKPSK